ncbi:MAG: HlyD family efflux transporter periplasmic adaptor subunit [Bacteroidales bacterium]|nr:HlyD family efflux transporter periplasmic adaptor subunit [Bacteroidales bacterium]
MSKSILISIIGILFLSSCGNENDKADAYGNFEATEIIISSETAGKIIKFPINEGQKLTDNQFICLIDTSDIFLKKEVLTAQKNALASKYSDILAQVKVFEEQKKVIEIEMNRINNLLKDSAATQKQADDIKGKINVLDKQIEQVKTQNKSLFNQLKVFDIQKEIINNQIRKSEIVNPVKGTVLTKYAEENEITLPGKPLYKIADLSEMKLRAYVSGKQLSSIKIGQKIKVFIDTNENQMKEYEGIVSQISDEAEFTPKIIQTKDERINLVYSIIIKVKNDGDLKIGMPGEVRFK